MSVTRRRWFPFTVTIDAQAIGLKLKRMTPEEFEPFDAEFTAFGEERGAPKMPAADAPPDREATAAAMAIYTEYLRTITRWQREVFRAYVRVDAGAFQEEDDQGCVTEVRDGGVFYDLIGSSDGPIIGAVLQRLWTENRLTDDQKKRLSLLSGSANGSREAAAEPGRAPEPRASNAGALDSSPNVVVTEAPNLGPSGGTVQ